MDNVNIAVESFREGLNCSQAIVAAYCQQFGLDRRMGAKVATGFGGGMRMAGACGAVTGAFMILGLKYGNTTAQDQPAKANTYKMVKEFTKRFKARNGSVICKDLLKKDISTGEGMKQAQESGDFSKRCPQMVKDAAEILEKMLAED